jgi:hypothetical protein
VELLRRADAHAAEPVGAEQRAQLLALLVVWRDHSDVLLLQRRGRAAAAAAALALQQVGDQLLQHVRLLPVEP